MTKPRHMEFDCIYVIQSLKEMEVATGEWLYEDTIDHIGVALRAKGFDVKSYLVRLRTAAELAATLEGISNEVVTNGRFPILHFEVHGTKTGLALLSGETVPWSDLVEPLTKINIGMQNNLLVTMAVCSGIYLATVLRASNPAPMWGVLGPDSADTNQALLAGFTAFYESFLTYLDGNRALAALREATKDIGSAKYLFLNAEQMFKKAFRAYVNASRDETSLNERIAKIRAKAKDPSALPDTATIKAKLMDVQPDFERFWRVHFMVDRYPENEERFPMTFDEVMND